MHTRSKVVELSSRKFQVRRLPTEVGSFILLRMLGVSMRSVAAETVQKKEPESEPKAAKEVVTGEMRVRALTFGVFSGSIGFDDFKFIQNHCLQVVGMVTERAGVEFPMPIMTDTGAWTPEGDSISNDVRLIMQLTTEVLIFCFADFFEDSSHGL